MTVSFEELADSYSCIFFDAYGVLKSSAGTYSGVIERLIEFNAQGKQVYVVTNDSSKSPERMAEGYASPGHGPVIPAQRIISSGLLATEFLRNKVPSGWVAYIGKPASAWYIEQAGLLSVPVSEVTHDHDPRALVLLDDEGFDWFRDLNRIVNLVRHHNMPVVIANGDVTYPSSPTDFNIAVGGLGLLLEHALSRSFIRFGKPDPMLFSYAYHHALGENPKLTKRDVLMVGDTLTTDILGGNKYGIDTVLVLSGTTSKEDYDARIRSSGIMPNYVCESILT
jgi:HAD superfamily hydrolase (TIGR01450 family)